MAKTKVRHTPPVIDVGVTAPDELDTVKDGAVVQDFLRGVRAFFDTAQTLETQALATLDQARKLTRPTTAAEDEAIQRFCQKTSADKKVVEQHWLITSVVYNFHRRLVARRERAAVPLASANTIANALHNTYVEAEKRRAAEEQERLRREREAAAQRERDAEIARMEAEALKREESSPTLSEREEVFVIGVLNGVPPGEAARRAGYKDPTRWVRLMELPKVKASIEAQQAARAIRLQAAAVKVQPLDVWDVEDVAANVTRAAGAHDRTTHGYELLDEPAFVAAALAGKHGIPPDVLGAKPAKLGEYARSLKERLNLWPGVRYKKTTRVI